MNFLIIVVYFRVLGAGSLLRRLLLSILQVQLRVVVVEGLRVQRIQQTLRLKWVWICHAKVTLRSILLRRIIEACLGKETL